MHIRLLSPGAMTPLPQTRNGRGVFRMVMPARYRFEPFGMTVDVPAGFETDGASIPWFARAWLSPWGRVAFAAILHDFLLETAHDWPKWLIDRAFHAAMLGQGVHPIAAAVMWCAVRTRGRQSPAAALAAS